MTGLDRSVLSVISVTIGQLPFPLCFTPNDLEPRSLDELAKQMRVSCAFLQLCMDAGCPMANGKASAGQLLLWLFDHYEDVRALAGLKSLATIDALTPTVTARLRVANALVTLLEFARMRASNWRQKRQLRRALEKVSQLCDRST